MEKIFGEFAYEFTENILPLYQKHEATFDKPRIHGRLHICRCLMFGEIMTRIYQAHNVDIDRCANRKPLRDRLIQESWRLSDVTENKKWQLDKLANIEFLEALVEILQRSKKILPFFLNIYELSQARHQE